MNTTATTTYQTPPYIYGQILNRSLCVPEEKRPPGIWTFISQGAVIGVIIEYLLVVSSMLRRPNFYNFLFIPALPGFLGVAMVAGISAGLVTWAFSRISGRGLGTPIRSMLGVLSVTGVYAVVYLSVPSNPYEPESNYLEILLFILVVGTISGMFIGSGLRPWPVLSRGMNNHKSDLVAKVSGLVLRLLIVFGLMESVVLLISTLQLNYRRADMVFTLFALGHFFTASIIVFARLKFVPLSLLAFIANVPVGSLILDFPDKTLIGFYISFGYLIVWAVFLLSRSALMQTALFEFKKELRYYLID